MRILFNIGHPAHVHLFRNLIWELESHGHRCKITAIEKDVSLCLLDAYGFEYEIVGKGKPTLITKVLELIRIESRLYWIARSFRPDLLIGGVGNVYIAHVGKLLRTHSVIFDDTEHAKIDHLLMDRFSSVICTPSCYRCDLGLKQVRYEGYHELAYLHPSRFTPNHLALSKIGLTENDQFIMVRFVSWDASHDIGQYGIRNRIQFVQELEKHGRVLITSEGQLPEEIEGYKISVSPEELHDLLYYASLYIGEGATMAVESAVLGTPSIYISSLIGKMGNLIELEEKYSLIISCEDSDAAISRAIELMQNPTAKNDWRKKRDRLIHDKIDVTSFMLEFIENYFSGKVDKQSFGVED